MFSLGNKTQQKQEKNYFLKSDILSWHKEKSIILISGKKVNELTKEHEQNLKDRNKHNTYETQWKNSLARIVWFQNSEKKANWSGIESGQAKKSNGRVWIVCHRK